MYRILRFNLIITLSFFSLHIFAGSNPTNKTLTIGSTRELSIPEYNSLYYNPFQDNGTANQTATKSTPEQDSIHSLAAFIKDQNRYIDRIDSSTVMDLPAGIVSNNGSLDYTILIKRLVITPDSGAYLEAYMSFEIPQNGRKIAFAAKHIPFSFSGGVKGDARLELLGDQAIELSNNILLTFKGDGGTYATFDCTGFKNMGIKAEIEFSANILVPEKPDGTPDDTKTLKSTFTTTIANWNDLIIDISIAPFQVKGLTGVGFNVTHAVFDFSDLNNAPGMVFPKNYQSSYFGNGMSINLWRGFYLKEATIKLPEEIKSKDSTGRLTLIARNLIIDEHGLSGTFGIKNLLPAQKGDMDGWGFSIDSLSVALTANQLTGAGFAGMMNIPVFKENSALNYSAIISAGGNYSFTVSSQKPVEMSLWAAKLVLLPTSSITIKVQNKKFLPEANLTGSISIMKDSNGGNDVVSVGSLSFEHLIIRTKSPVLELGAISLGAGNQNDLGKFPIMINNIGFKKEKSRAGISFDVIVNLMQSSDEGFGAAGGFIVWGKQDSISNKWKFDGIEVTKLSVDIEKKNAFELHGKIVFFRGDSTYGKGFKGDIDAKFGGSIGLQATALFGCINDMRYWYADAMVNISSGIPCGSFSIYGFGGGAYHHMRQKGFNESKGSSIGASRSGIIYVPTPDVALGLKASVAIGSARPEVVNGDATFEISFNSSGGINQIGFEGNVYFMTSQYTSAMSDVSSNSKKLSNGAGGPEKSADAGRGQVWGNIKLLYDAVNKVFHGEVKVYANVADGIIKGMQAQDLAGTAIIHFESKQWYIYIGTPTNPVGIEIARIIKTKSYFMAGCNLPASPPPPAKVSEILGGKNLDYMRELNALEGGRGLAFGASFEISTGDLRFLIFYANLTAGTGFDLMLKDYGEAQCEGKEGPIGINGWYANGQAYAYIEGKIGIKVNLLFYKGNYTILDVGMAAVLQAKGPNPFWMKGVAGGRYSILGGLVSGNCQFEFTIGEECKLSNASVLGGINIISELTPTTGSQGVDVFNTPQAVFNMPVGKEFTIKDDNGKDRIFRIKLDYFKLLSNNSAIPGSVTWNSGNDVAAFNNTDIFPSSKDITASVQVSFEEKINSIWTVVLSNGSKVTEQMASTFNSGTAPDYIPISNVQYSYPIINQYNFYKNEYNKGYVMLKKGQPELFNAPKGFIQKGRIKTGQNQYLFDISYNNGMVNFSLPAGLNNSVVFTLDIVNLPAQAAGAIDRNVSTVVTNLNDNKDIKLQTKDAEGTITTLQEKSILTYYFRTSKYNTFNEKINSMTISTGWRRPIRTNVHEVGVTLHGDEMFDMLETNWTETIVPVVQFEAAFSETPWFVNYINPLIYNGYPIVECAKISWRDASIVGVPPSKAVYIRQYPNDRMVTPEDVAGTNTLDLPDAGAFVYNVAHFADCDYNDMRNKLANYYSNGAGGNSQVYQMLTSMFPGIKNGDYPFDIKYVLPGINQVTTKRRIVINNPIPDI